MKKILTILLVVLLPLLASAQKDFNKFTNALAKDNGVTIIRIDEEIIDIYKNSDLDAETHNILNNIKKVNLVKISKRDGYSGKIENIIKMIDKYFDLDDYKLVKSSATRRGNYKVFITGSKDKRLLVINQSRNTTITFIDIIGKFKISDLTKLSRALNIEGLSSLDDIYPKSKYNRYNGIDSKKAAYAKKQEDFFKNKKNYKDFKYKKNYKDFEYKNTSSTSLSHEDRMKKYQQKMKEMGKDLSEEVEKLFVYAKSDEFKDRIKKIETWAKNVGNRYSKSFNSKNNEIDDKKMDKMLSSMYKYVDSNDDCSYNINLKGAKSTIRISPDANTICIIDGKKCKNTDIKKLKKGELRNLCLIKNKTKKKKYMVITTNKELGGDYVRSFSKIKTDNQPSITSENIAFKYNGKDYSYSSAIDKKMPKLIVDGNLKNSLDGVKIEYGLLQIRPATKIEKEAYIIKGEAIIITTR